MRSSRASSEDSFTWDRHYKQLKRYFKQQGHSRVPSSHDPELCEWVKQQREDRRSGVLSSDRMEKLEKLDFYWGKKKLRKKDSFDEMHEQLREFYDRKGHTRVPLTSALGVWCQKQRTKLRENTISPDRRARLEELGFESDANDDNDDKEWERQCELLSTFYQDHGNYVVPKDHALHAWVKKQRREYRGDRLSKERLSKLEGMHFCWTEAEAVEQQTTWDRNYEKLKRFQKRKGHSFVQRSDDLSLWRWTEKNDWKQRRGILPRKQYQRLESLGFWDPPPDNLSERGENNEIDDVAYIVGNQKGKGKKNTNDNEKSESEEEAESEEEEEEEADDDDDDDDEEEYAEDDNLEEDSDADDDDDDMPTRTKDLVSPASTAFRKREKDNDTAPRSKKRMRRSSTFDDSFKTLYQVGTKVMKYFDDYGWFEGEIISIYEENVYKIRYEDDDEETYLIPNEKKGLDKIVKNAELLRYPVGTRVKKYFEDYGWFQGEVVAQEKDRYKVHYDDGDREEYIFANDMEELDEIVANARSQ